ncbi:RHS repeat-associated core domain-containing protein [Leptospira venezuelensis]|uniref:RHS repeat-associated core domain-containing protein n=2 Tax=Leptospira venezuelensis TaxID=1958811 RepID=UPI000A3A755C|nr:RHS repeat-associated core domain-containing protein [Leptospira venezuelensis]
MRKTTNRIRKFFSAEKIKETLNRREFTRFLFIVLISLFGIIGSIPSTSMPMPLPAVSVDPSGKLSVSFPITLPVGTRGMTPDLSLTYTSNTEDGFLGVGWTIPTIHYIKRDSSFGINYDTNDHFYTSLAGRLVSQGSGNFRSKSESFIRFQSFGTCGIGPCKWVATDRTGMTYTFGYLDGEDTSSNSRIPGPSGGHVNTWALQEVKDKFGNGYSIQYEVDTGGTDFRPILIRYNIHPDDSGNSQNNRAVQFNYVARSTISASSFPSYSEGILTQSSKLLQSLKVYVGSSITSGNNIYSYTFTYQKSPGSKRARLESIKRDGYDPVDFTYSDGTSISLGLASSSPVNVNLMSSIRQAVPYPGVKRADGALIDQNICVLGYAACWQTLFSVPCTGFDPTYQTYSPLGCNPIYEEEHLACTVYVAEGWKYIANGFAAPDVYGGSVCGACMTGASVPTSLSFPIDFEGDGKMEFMSIVGTDGIFLPLPCGFDSGVHGAGFALQKISSLSSNSPTREAKISIDPTFKENSFHGIGDFDGDGRNDLIYGVDQNENPNLAIMFSDGSKWNTPVATNVTSDIGPAQYMLASGPTWTSADRFALEPMYWTGDFDGDGRTDLMRRTSDGLSLEIFRSQYSKQTGSFRTPSFKFNFDFQSGYADDKQLLDIDGDSRVELVEWTSSKIYITYFNSGLTGIQKQVTVALNTTKGNIFFPSVNGDNKTDFAYLTSDHKLHVCLNTGVSFTNTCSTSTLQANFIVDWRNPDDDDGINTRQFADVSGDGLEDFLFFDGSLLHVAYSNGTGYPAESVTPIALPHDRFYGSFDVDGDSVSDIISIDFATNTFVVSLIPKNSNGLDLLTVISRDTGKSSAQSSTISYKLKSDIPKDYSTFNTLSYPITINASPEYMVASTITDYAGGTDPNYVRSYTYDYGISLYYNGNASQRGVLGPSSFKVKDISDPNGVTRTYTLNQSSPQMSGKVNLLEVKNANGSLISTTANTLSEVITAGIAGTTWVRLDSTVTDLYNNDGSNHISTTTLNYSNYTNEGNYQTVQDIATAYSPDGTVTDKITKAIVYESVPADGVYDRIVTASSSDSNGNLISKAVLKYDSSEHLIQKDVYSTSSSFISTYYQNFDTFGNPQNIVDNNNNVTQLTYDAAVHNDPILIQQPNGSYVIQEFDPIIGKIKKKSIPLNGSSSAAYGAIPYTITDYDYYYRVSKVYYPGETNPNEVYSYDNIGDPTQQSVTKTLSASGSSSDSTFTTTFIDPMGRNWKNVSAGFANQNLTQESKYNALDQLVSRTNSYFSNMDKDTTLFSYDVDGSTTTINDLAQQSSAQISYNGSSATKEVSTTSADPNSGQSVSGTTKTYIETKDGRGRTISYIVTGNGGDGAAVTNTTQYTYFPSGKVKNTIAGGASTLTTGYTYDLLGRKLSQTSQNSGTIVFNYDDVNQSWSQTDSRGKTVQYFADSLGRIIKIARPDGEKDIEFYYDQGGFANQLTSSWDDSGAVAVKYDQRGNISEKIYYPDQTGINSGDASMAVKFQYDFDALKRLKHLTYPDGTQTHAFYSNAGYLGEITMDSFDKQSTNYPLVTYGLAVGSNQYAFTRTTGNNVQTQIYVDPIFQRVTNYTTNGTGTGVEQNISLGYDGNGNVTSIVDGVTPVYSRSFTYDGLDRLVSSYRLLDGQINNYQYDDTGRMTQNAGVSLSYTDGQHYSAVTSATVTENGVTNTYNYSYDASGNMINRNGDTFLYDSLGRLSEIDAVGGTTSKYIYRSSGTRAKKILPDGSKVYEFDKAYEILQRPSQPDQHTIYVRGYKDELVSQFSRSNAVLLPVASADTTGANDLQRVSLSEVISKSGVGFLTRFLNAFVLEKAKFLGSGISWASLQFLLEGNRISTRLQVSLFTVILLAILSFSLYQYKTNRLFIRKRLSGFGLTVYTINPILIVSFVFLSVFGFGGCGVLVPNKSGDPPWADIAIGINGQTPGLGNHGGGDTPPDPSGASGSPVQGIYWFHPDHLGNVVMVTDSNGNAANGGDLSGKVNIVYDAYGKIDASNSTGPDMFRFKYTEQEDDSESGLYYFGFRYYDSFTGRFITPDDRITGAPMGSDQYMYVNGNPMSHTDIGGHLSGSQLMDRISKSMQEAIIEAAYEENPILTLMFLQWQRKQAEKAARRELQRMQTIEAIVLAVQIGVAGYAIGIAAFTELSEAATVMERLEFVSERIFESLEYGMLNVVQDEVRDAVIYNFQLQMLASGAGRLIGGYDHGLNKWDKKGAERGQKIGEYSATAYSIFRDMRELFEFEASPDEDGGITDDTLRDPTEFHTTLIEKPIPHSLPILFSAFSGIGPAKILENNVSFDKFKEELFPEKEGE